MRNIAWWSARGAVTSLFDDEGMENHRMPSSPVVCFCKAPFVEHIDYHLSGWQGCLNKAIDCNKSNISLYQSQRHYACRQHGSFRGNVATVASRWKHCAWFDQPKIWTWDLVLQRRTRYARPIVRVHLAKMLSSTTVVCDKGSRNFPNSLFTSTCLSLYL